MHYLCNLKAEYFQIHKNCLSAFLHSCGLLFRKPFMLALAGQPSLHGLMYLWFIGLKGHLGEIAGKNKIRPLFLFFLFFCLIEILGKGSVSGILAFIDWEGVSGPGLRGKEVGFCLGASLSGLLSCWQCWGRCSKFAWCSSCSSYLCYCPVQEVL